MSDAGAVLFARIFSLTSAAIQLPFLTRFLVPEEYGLVAVAMVLGTYLSLIGAEAFILPFQRFPGTASAPENYSYAFRRLAVTLLILAAVVTVAGIPFDGLAFTFGIAGWGLGVAVNRFMAAVWLMWEKPWSYAWSLILGTGLRTFVLVAMVYLHFDVGIAVGVAGLASVVGALILSPRIGCVSRLDERPWKLAFGVSLAFGSLAFTVMSNFSLLVLPLLIEKHEVGRFAAMSQLVTLSVGALLGLGSTVLYPRLQRIWTSGRDASARNFVNMLCYASIILGASITLIAKTIGATALDIVVGGDYVHVSVFIILVAGTVVSQIGQFLSWIHTFTVESYKIRNAAVWATGIGSLLTLFLILNLGIVGAAIGMLVSFSLYALLMFRSSKMNREILFYVLMFFFITASISWLDEVVSNFTLGMLCMVCAFHILREIRKMRGVDRGSRVPVPEA